MRLFLLSLILPCSSSLFHSSISSEVIQALLSIQLCLHDHFLSITDNLKMWFCHPTLKERKAKEEDQEEKADHKNDNVDWEVSAE